MKYCNIKTLYENQTFKVNDPNEKFQKTWSDI